MVAIVLLWTVLPLQARAEPAQQAANTPTCFGQVATIVGSGTIVGTSGPDVIVGSDGPDVINGSFGDDLICGLGGNDTINGGHDNDKIDGGDGDDRIDGSHGDDELYGGPGNDLISASFGKDRIDGGDSDDTIGGDFAEVTIDGGPGVNTCRARDAKSTIVNCQTASYTSPEARSTPVVQAAAPPAGAQPTTPEHTAPVTTGESEPIATENAPLATAAGAPAEAVAIPGGRARPEFLMVGERRTRIRSVTTDPPVDAFRCWQSQFCNNATRPAPKGKWLYIETETTGPLPPARPPAVAPTDVTAFPLRTPGGARYPKPGQVEVGAKADGTAFARTLFDVSTDDRQFIFRANETFAEDFEIFLDE